MTTVYLVSVVVPPVVLLDATAELIAAGPQLTDQFDAGLRGLIRLLEADRGDCGFVRASSPSYCPSQPLVSAPWFEAPIGDPLMQAVLGAQGAFYVGDIRSEIADGPVRDLLMASDTRSIVVERLDHNDDAYGLVCIDWVGREAEVPKEALELVDYFVCKIWTPLLMRSAVQGEKVTGDRLAPLTAAERSVVELAAAGLSYREIANSRQTSVNTVSQQLRAARRKVKARNTAELCGLVGQVLEPIPSQNPAIDSTKGPGVRFTYD